MPKVISNNPILDLVDMNACNEIWCKFVLKILSVNKILAFNKDNNSATNVQKGVSNNPNLDLVNMNAYIRFGEIL